MLYLKPIIDVPALSWLMEYHNFTLYPVRVVNNVVIQGAYKIILVFIIKAYVMFYMEIGQKNVTTNEPLNSDTKQDSIMHNIQKTKYFNGGSQMHLKT